MMKIKMTLSLVLTLALGNNICAAPQYNTLEVAQITSATALLPCALSENFTEGKTQQIMSVISDLLRITNSSLHIINKPSDWHDQDHMALIASTNSLGYNFYKLFKKKNPTKPVDENILSDEQLLKKKIILPAKLKLILKKLVLVCAPLAEAGLKTYTAVNNLPTPDAEKSRARALAFANLGHASSLCLKHPSPFTASYLATAIACATAHCSFIKKRDFKFSMDPETGHITVKRNGKTHTVKTCSLSGKAFNPGDKFVTTPCGHVILESEFNKSSTVKKCPCKDCYLTVDSSDMKIHFGKFECGICYETKKDNRKYCKNNKHPTLLCTDCYDKTKKARNKCPYCNGAMA